MAMVERGQRKFAFLATLESLIWHSLVLFHHQTRQYKQNSTHLNFAY